MSCSSPREPSEWLADRRGQTEPIAALVALLAIGIGLGLYAGVAADQSPEGDRTDAEATMQLVEAAVLEDGVFSADSEGEIDPEQFARAGESVRVEIRNASGLVAAYGARAPSTADSASRPVTVGRDRRRAPGRLTVRVWET